jgi:hypothetical protein
VSRRRRPQPEHLRRRITLAEWGTVLCKPSFGVVRHWITMSL